METRTPTVHTPGAIAFASRYRGTLLDELVVGQYTYIAGGTHTVLVGDTCDVNYRMQTGDVCCEYCDRDADYLAVTNGYANVVCATCRDSLRKQARKSGWSFQSDEL